LDRITKIEILAREAVVLPKLIQNNTLLDAIPSGEVLLRGAERTGGR
jgi:hypothetical protein